LPAIFIYENQAEKARVDPKVRTQSQTTKNR
jgi:hypothetical protein